MGAFVGLNPPAFRDRDSVPDAAKLAAAGTLASQVRNADGLRGLLAEYFQVPVQLREFIGHWLHLVRADQSALAASHARLGQGAVLGRKVYDRQCRFRIELGPLSWSLYEAFLPTGKLLRPLIDWLALRAKALTERAKGRPVIRLTLTQSGGIANLQVPPLVIDGEALSDDAVRKLSEAITAARFFDLAEDYPTLGADLFAYTITVEMNGRSHTVSYSEDSVPAQLQPLLDWLSGRQVPAQSGTRR